MTDNYQLFIEKIESDARPRRIRENLAVERLVRRAFGDDARKYNLPSGAPAVSVPGRLDPVLSISHSETYAVLVQSLDGSPVGVDIETFRPALRKVMPKFLNDDEAAVYGSDDGLLSAWTLKEAAYKAAGKPGLSLLDIHLPLSGDIITLADGRRLRIVESQFREGHRLSLVALA